MFTELFLQHNVVFAGEDNQNYHVTQNIWTEIL